MGEPPAGKSRLSLYTTLEIEQALDLITDAAHESTYLCSGAQHDIEQNAEHRGKRDCAARCDIQKEVCGRVHDDSTRTVARSFNNAPHR
ncbi:MAG TPA: hypothetical protein VHD38_01900 [Candidatus Paceibacterota bacterium]|jgi:hypothetical protein|nr:hypothetical protein [Candidatus Paceibacterota bacterium]